MRVLVDTNIIARLAQPAHHHHSLALKAMEGLLQRKDDPCIVPQVLYEFWVIATKPTAANGLGLSVESAQIELGKARHIFTFLRDERAVYDHWEKLVTVHDVHGKIAHDARLVAAMMRHELTHLLTFNVRDSSRFSITVFSPDELIPG